jgi:hypothetical protein
MPNTIQTYLTGNKVGNERFFGRLNFTTEATITQKDYLKRL